MEEEKKAVKEKLKASGLKKSAIRRLENELSGIEAKISRKKTKLANIQKPFSKMYWALPFGQVALGKKEGENKASQDAKDNGMLKNLMIEEEMDQWIESKKAKVE